MEGLLVMSSKERERLKVLARVKRGELNLKEAAELMALSYRQCRRLYKRQREWGDRGLLHLDAMLGVLENIDEEQAQSMLNSG